MPSRSTISAAIVSGGTGYQVGDVLSVVGGTAGPGAVAQLRVTSVNPANGAFEVKKLNVAMDLGTVVNPDGVKAQIEGSTLWGMSLALFEKAPLKDGALQVSNFGDYTPMRMSEMPDLDISIIANNDPPSGCGEPGVTVVAPAIANAIFNACGARVRSLPITQAAVREALQAKKT